MPPPEPLALDPAREVLCLSYSGMLRELNFTELWRTDPAYNQKLLGSLSLLSERDVRAVAQSISFHKSYDKYIPVVALGSGVTFHLGVGYACKAILSRPIPPLASSVGVALYTAVNFMVSDRFFYGLRPFQLAKEVENPQGVLQALYAIRNGDSSMSSFTLPEHLPVQPASDQAAPSPPSAHAPTHWDEIRKSQSNAATPSTWDKLRQDTGARAARSSTSEPTQQLTNEEDRTRAQAEFDALLERERNSKR